MSEPEAHCPQCRTHYPWGTTVCPACHVGLERSALPPVPECTAVIFETWDRPSLETVVSILQAQGIPSLVRGTADRWPFAGPRGGFWRLAVRPGDEPRAQAILDTEIGRGERDPKQRPD